MYVGRRVNTTNPHERTGPGAVEVELYFLHLFAFSAEYVREVSL